MDEFAQTRGVDDLFDDEIIPVPPSQVEVEYTDDIAPYDAPLLDQQTAPVDRAAGQYRRRGNARGRGPRGGGLYVRGAKSVGAGNRHNHKQDESEASALNHGLGGNQSEKEATPASEVEAAAENGGDLKSKDAASKPKVPAVRGDRSGTGGVKKPKLTEEELSERLAAVKIAAAKRAAAHARAEADEASFQERERIAAEKRVQERQNHRTMVSERERNRQRKLQAQTGREWDAEKSQDTFADRGGSAGMYRRGMHGGVASGDGRRGENYVVVQEGEHEQQPGDGGYRSRGNRGGRGGRGRGYGRARSFGDSRSANEAVPSDAVGKSLDTQSPPALGTEGEFPALPGGRNASQPVTVQAEQSTTAAATLDTPISPLPLQGSWADHIDALEAKEAEKKAAAQST